MGHSTQASWLFGSLSKRGQKRTYLSTEAKTVHNDRPPGQK
jgi:hypothetical protein